MAVSTTDLDYMNVHQHWQVALWRGTPVVVFDDERAVLTALWEATHLGWLRETPTLIRLDAHHDQWPLAASGEAAWLEAIRRNDRREVWNSVEFDIGCDDADWVRAAVVAGLVRDIVTFYVTERPDPPAVPGVRSLLLGGLGAELGPGGALALAGPADTSAANLDIPGWDARTARFGADGRPVVLSIDLDAFSTDELGDQPRAWPDEQLEEELCTPRPHAGGALRVADVLRGIAQDAALVTIAREPWYCGGDLAAARLLSVLDEVVFDSALHHA